MTFSRRRRLERCALGAAALVALSVAPAADAGVVFPSPGAMVLQGLPARVRAGHTWTLREVLPLAIFGGRVRLQQQSSVGAWQTVTSAAVRPRVVWLHWKVPASLGGSQIAVRFVLASGGQTLAVSATYPLTVLARGGR
jgi:hypothetical protein